MASFGTGHLANNNISMVQNVLYVTSSDPLTRWRKISCLVATNETRLQRIDNATYMSP
jgi:hypothetical protein